MEDTLSRIETDSLAAEKCKDRVESPDNILRSSLFDSDVGHCDVSR